MAADYFLKLDPKIEGEATDGKHKGEIELESWRVECLLGTPERWLRFRQVGPR